MKIGIDFGTTNTLAAYLDDGRPRMIPNRRGSFVTPSMIGIDSGGRYVVGESARNQRIGAPTRTVDLVKREIGLRKTIAFNRKGGTDTPREALSPEELVGLVLREMRADAETFLGTDVDETVVTVPAHYDDRQRSATIEAALLAGFTSVSLLNEPTAAALPYAQRSENHERIVVFDFGGGTLDVSCLERDGSDYIVQATRGDGELGGSNIDQALYDYILHHVNPDISAFTDDPSGRQIVLEAIERAKIDLSEHMETSIVLPFVHNAGSAAHIDISLSRDALNRVIAPFIERARVLTATAVQEAGFARRGFDTLVLSGGSSRLPIVREMLLREFGVAPAGRIHPEEVVASGAALYGSDDAMSGLYLREALSQTLSIELSDGSCVPVIRKNQSVPASRTRIFTTVSDRQIEADIHLLQGDDAEAANNRSLGRFTLKNIESAAQGKARIAVTVSVDADGLVTLRAGDRATGVQRQMTTRSRTESKRNDIEGSLESYLASLRRRVQQLSACVNADLRSEMEQIVTLLSAGHGSIGDDMVTVLETLILEAVAEQSKGPTQGAGRAAS